MYDVIIVGGGAAGLATAGIAKGNVCVVSNLETLGQKILVSGGGKCNFCNRDLNSLCYQSMDMEIVHNFLNKLGEPYIIKLIRENGLNFDERTGGKLFAKSGTEVLNLILNKCKENNVEFIYGVAQKLSKIDDIFQLDLDQGHKLFAKKIVIATGGKSYASLGATDFGLCVAKDFDIKIAQTFPALCGIKYPKELEDFAQLAGISVEAKITIPSGREFKGSLLFAHYGMTGPVCLDASLFLNYGDEVKIDFTCSNIPARMVIKFGEFLNLKERSKVIKRMKSFIFIFDKTFGYMKAEVMRGGVRLNELNDNFEVKKVSGLYFIGEVLDFTGIVGGYNLGICFQMGFDVGKGL